MSQHSPILHRDLRGDHRVAARGHGVYLYDTTGRRYLDAAGGSAVNVIGHGVAEITAELPYLHAELTYTYGDTFVNPWQLELADRVSAMSPIRDPWIMFVSSGSEATETAIKLARQFHVERGNANKWKVISRWQSYHGNTIGAAALSGRPSWRDMFDPYFFHVPRVSAPYGYRAPTGLSDADLVGYWAEELERVIFHEGAETISAFIAEPVLGSSLVGVVPPPGYYQRIREICDEHDILFIADEVLAGYGRTGRNFSIDHWSVVPDIITAAKGVGSGYTSIGVCILAERIGATIRDTSGRHTQGFTYSGLPIACHIATKVNDFIVQHDLVEHSRTAGLYLRARLEELQQKHDAIGDVRGLGTLAGIEFVADRTTKEPFDPAMRVAQSVVRACAERGVIVNTGTPSSAYGAGGDQIQITPPYVISNPEIDELVDALDGAITETLASVRVGS